MDTDNRRDHLCIERAAAVADKDIQLLLVADVSDEFDGIGRMEWEVGSQYGGSLFKGFLQCQSRHTTAAGIESVKEQYLLLLLHIGVQRYYKNRRKTPVDALFRLFLTIGYCDNILTPNDN